MHCLIDRITYQSISCVYCKVINNATAYKNHNACKIWYFIHSKLFSFTNAAILLVICFSYSLVRNLRNIPVANFFNLVKLNDSYLSTIDHCLAKKNTV